MRKTILFLLVIAAVLISSFQPTLAVAAAQEPKTATLGGLNFVPGKGWVAIFNISGTWKKGDLKGHSLSVDGKNFALYCNFKDDGRVACTTGSLALYVGKLARIFFAGQTFTAIVPEKTVRGPAFAECPGGSTEIVLIEAVDSNGVGVSGGISYPADDLTIDEAVAAWIDWVETTLNVTIVSSQITEVVCNLGT